MLVCAPCCWAVQLDFLLSADSFIVWEDTGSIFKKGSAGRFGLYSHVKLWCLALITF